MTEKRFIQPNKECRVIKNTKTGETAIYYDTEDGLMFLKWLNNLSDENEQLKNNIKEVKAYNVHWKTRKKTFIGNLMKTLKCLFSTKISIYTILTSRHKYLLSA